MSLNAKKIFVNSMAFISLLVSWWLISLFVSASASDMNGKYFDASSPVLAGSYYNDWLPVFAAGSFGLGWIIAVWVAATFVKKEWQAMPFLIFSAVFPGVLGFVIYIGVKDVSDAMVRDLFHTSAQLFVSGSVMGAVIGVLRRMERDVSNRDYIASQPR